ncbi:MAG: HNH endonuclease family protein, partial [Oscillospiraceae bacterium]|nr:HNH endonuclease family protein [Oscillospiraceae bacterium]
PDEDEQQVFDTINSLGVKLTTAELLKNYLFTRENVQQYSQVWEDVFEKDAATRAYWDMEVEAGRFKRSLIDLFLDAYFQILIREPSRNVSANDLTLYARTDRLARSYQDFVKKYCGGDKNVILDELKVYADLFRKNIDPEWCNKSIPAQYGIERLNVIMFGLKNTTPIPYLLFIEKNVTSEEEQIEMYRVLESYLMRRMVVSASTKNYNNLFISLTKNRVTDHTALIRELSARTDKSTIGIPDDDKLRDGFQNSFLYNVESKGILYLIESAIRPKESAVSLLGFRSYSLEHLMPKKWRNNWELNPSTPETQKERDRKLLTLGNLAIITQSLNASIRDSKWEKKKNPQPFKGKERPGLVNCANGLETMLNVLDKEVWDEQEITARADWLYEQAAKLWAI